MTHTLRMRARRASVAIGSASIVLGCASSAPESASRGASGEDGTTAPRRAEYPTALTTTHPAGKGGGTRPTNGGAVTPMPDVTATNGIGYQGGPIMSGTTHIYYIWYGNWAGNSATSILTDLASSIGGSPYYNINTTYCDNSGACVANAVSFAGSTTDAYSQGTALSDAQIASIVSGAIGRGLPADTHGVYFVLTSADVTATSGFCSAYCGWHTHASMFGIDIKYAFVGNPDRCSVCEAQTVGPNGNAGADGMASIIAHELDESVTDPDLNAWYTPPGFDENADMCAWTFGAQYTTANGAHANVRLGARDYLIQQNWVNASGGSCALSYTTPCTPGQSRSCCAFSGGCGCSGDQTCTSTGTWGICIGSTPRGHQCL